MNQIAKVHQAWRLRRQQKQHRLSQGRLTANEAAILLDQEGHIPLAGLPLGKNDAKTVYLPMEDKGHLLLLRRQIVNGVNSWHSQ